MGKLSLALVCYVVLITTTTVHATFGGTKEVDEWFHKLSHAKKKVTKLHFYFHDKISSPNPSVVTVAQSSMTKKSGTFFGTVNIMDDKLTVGADPASKQIGRAQGLYASAGLEDLSLLMSMSLVFTSGKFNGSSLVVMGRNPALHSPRELPIIGGTGAFRFANGFATLYTHSLNFTTGDATVKYNVVIFHYKGLF